MGIGVVPPVAPPVTVNPPVSLGVLEQTYEITPATGENSSRSPKRLGRDEGKGPQTTGGSDFPTPRVDGPQPTRYPGPQTPSFND